MSFRPLWPVPTLPAADSLPVSVAASAASAPADVHMADGDAESNASYDPLFDDADDDVPPPAPSTILAGSGTPGLSFPAPGSGVNPKLALPGTNTTPQKPLALPNGSAPKFAAAAAPSVPVARTAPALAPLSPTSYRAFSDDVILTSAMDGNIVLVDRRAKSYESGGVGRLLPGDKAPPWCMSVSFLPQMHTKVLIICRLLGRPTERRCLPVGGMERLISGMSDAHSRHQRRRRQTCSCRYGRPRRVGQ